MSAVEITNISKAFNLGSSNQVDALTDINLSIASGEFVSLIGPSGCGKSTLLRLIANLIEPTSGNLVVNGKSAKQARLDQDYGMAFQQSGLLNGALLRRTSNYRSNSRAGIRRSVTSVHLKCLNSLSCLTLQIIIRGNFRAGCSNELPSLVRLRCTRQFC